MLQHAPLPSILPLLAYTFHLETNQTASLCRNPGYLPWKYLAPECGCQLSGVLRRPYPKWKQYTQLTSQLPSGEISGSRAMPLGVLMRRIDAASHVVRLLMRISINTTMQARTTTSTQPPTKRLLLVKRLFWKDPPPLLSVLGGSFMDCSPFLYHVRCGFFQASGISVTEVRRLSP